MAIKTTKHIVILVPPMTSILDVAGPMEVFSKTSDYLDDQIHNEYRYYTIHLVSMNDSLTLPTTSGMPIICEGNLTSINYPIDSILIAGRGIYQNGAPENILNLLQMYHSKTPNIRIGSICAGAFILAEAGLLDGKMATTHWQLWDSLAQKYPNIQVQKDPIYVKHGNIYTSAGISTGIDLSLALVEEDLGKKVSIEISKILVLYLKRPGGQSQISNILQIQKTDYKPVADTVLWIQENLDKDLSIERLADRTAMSSRNFSRMFFRETGETPAKFIEKTRVEAAKRRLEETYLSLEEIARECGFGNVNGLRRLFNRHLQTTPSVYRKNFS
ncbi:GlxA family transcriptional regulator [Chryseobacterium gleum]|uniref:GlxA family transcriptional regulator n=1 Tax=Chryseobacterium gleum TaxID=250 RepID=UPI0028AF2A9E|nr:helix-turn-helix domain-containing protein [Chryseobacterium gleum]